VAVGTLTPPAVTGDEGAGAGWSVAIGDQFSLVA